MRVPRPYQTAAFGSIRDSLRNGVRHLCCCSPTGSGKTFLASEIANGAMRKGNRMAFVVPRIDLIDQTLEEFADEGITDVGVIQADHVLTDWNKPIQICSIQTIKRKGAYPAANVVVFDECHTLFEEHTKWMTDPAWADVPFIGFSATPWTKGLGKWFESLLIVATTAELIEQGFLSKFQVFAASHPDLTQVRTVAGEYVTPELSGAMQQNNLTADIIGTWIKRWNKDKTLVFGVDCLHAQALQARFQEAGITCGYQDARTPQFERSRIKKAFHNGELRVVCNVDTLTLGVDWDVRCLSLCRPTRSEMRYVQIIGRALRTAPGKDAALILDHSDTTQRLGFVTDIHHEHLSGGPWDDAPKKAANAIAIPKECPQCACLVPVGTKICPACGFERNPLSGVLELDGELVEYVGGGRRRGDPNRHFTEVERLDFLAQLKGYAEINGRRPGWVWHTYRERFPGEEWPRSKEASLAPKRPGTHVLQFIQNKNKKYIDALRSGVISVG